MATTNNTTPTTPTNITTTTTTPNADDDYITVVEVDEPASKDTNTRQLVKQRQSSVEEDSSYITVLTINNQTQQLHRHSDGSGQGHGSISVNGEQMGNFSDAANSTSTVNAIEAEAETELLIVHRQPGERLGFGLKFQGGTRSAEKVHKLFIQSCAAESPASKVRASWGALREGDEIVSIDGQRVCELTRIECVRCLKDNVAIELQVRNGYGRKPEAEEEVGMTSITTVDGGNNGSAPAGVHVLSNDTGGGDGGGGGGGSVTTVTMSNGQMKGSPPPPPPVPPRKLVKRKSLNGENKVVLPAAAAEISNSTSAVAPAITLSAPQTNETEKPFTPPPDAEYYINLFADGQSLKTESESDDTASTRSTVIDKYSMSSNYSSESDLSSYTSLTNGQSVINKSELAKVLKPFTMLEQEFNVNVNGNATAELEECLKEVVASTGDVMPDLLATAMTAQAHAKKPMSYIPGNNYENVEFKTEKINTYENVELKPQMQGAPIIVLPTPKPRQVAGAASGASCAVEPKKRSIIPTPRKIATPTKLPIQVAPPMVPAEAAQGKALTKAANAPKTPTTTSTPVTHATPPLTPTHKPPAPANTPTTPSYDPTQSTKEFITKIPKAIASVFGPNSQRAFERAKTEGEIKLKQPADMSASMKQQTAMFLDKECHSSTDSVASTIRKPVAVEQTKTPEVSKLTPPPKSRIPVVLSPKRSLELDTHGERKLSASPSNIPRFLTHKQKSETDLKLGLYRSKSKEASPPLSLKIPLQRTNSVESKLKSPERTLIPVFGGQSASAEAILTATTPSTPTKVKGPKPKPPERVQSLAKTPPTHIPKLQTSPAGGAVTVTLVDRSATTPQHTPPAAQNNAPTMQTFKQQTPPAGASPNREIRFKIQTYESKAQEPRTPFTDVSEHEADKMPSLFDLVRKHSPETQRKDEPTTTLSSFKPTAAVKQEQQLESMVDDEDTPPAVVGKCIKVNDSQPTYYSSSSEDDEEDGSSAVDNDGERDYECEDGEKLGPPEVINGPGPSEAYFNLYWHSNMLPTIGEVEEEFSSLEPQSLPNGPIVIVDDLSQQTKQSANNVQTEKSAEKTRVAETPKDKKEALRDIKETEENRKAETKKVKEEGTKYIEEKETKTPDVTKGADCLSSPKTSPSATNKFRKPHFIGLPVKPPSVPTMEAAQTNAKQPAIKADKQASGKVTAETTETNSDNGTMKENVNVSNTTTTTKFENDKINDAAVEIATDVNYQTSEFEEAKGAPAADMQNNKANGMESCDNNDATITFNQVTKKAAASQVSQKVNEPTVIVSDTAQGFEVGVENTNKLKRDREDEEEAKGAQVLTETKTEKAETRTEKAESKTETAETTSKTTSSNSQTTTQKVEEKTEQKSESSSEKVAHTKTTTTTTKKHVTKSSMSSSTELIANTNFDALDGLSEDMRKLRESVGKVASPTTASANKPIAFTLQPYTERVTAAGSPRITVFEERQYETKQNAYTEIRTRDAAGEEKVQTSAVTHKERAKLKKVHSHEDELDRLGIALDDAEIDIANDKSKPMTVTATAETRILELADNPQDKQSIERGILNLSESGKQLQRNEAGGVEYVECEHHVQDAYEDTEQILGGGDVALDKEPTLLRELSETLIVTKDGEKQVTHRSETTKETPKKGVKLLKKSEDERRLELEAQKLIESYQKVKKEAEKLFQQQSSDEGGFDFGDEQQVNVEKENNGVTVEEIVEPSKVTKDAKIDEVYKEANEQAKNSKTELEKTAVEYGEMRVEEENTSQVSQKVEQKTELVSGRQSPAQQKLDTTKLTAGFLEEERRLMAQEKALREKQDKLRKDSNATEVVTKVETKREVYPSAQLEQPSTPPDLLDIEPIYVLHKNIIEEPKSHTVLADFVELDATPMPPELNECIEIEETTKLIDNEVQLPTPALPFETVEIQIKEKLPTPKSARKTKVSDTVTKKATKPTTPPIPQKREHKSTEKRNSKKSTPAATTPTPKKRGSIDMQQANTVGDHTTCATNDDDDKAQTSKLEIPINTKTKFQQNLEQAQPTQIVHNSNQHPQPQPTSATAEQQQKLEERIIVGVEQQQFVDAKNNKEMEIITFASQDLPTEITVNSLKQVVASVVSSSGNVCCTAGGASGNSLAELHLETINLPNEPQNSLSKTAEKLKKSERLGDGMQMPKTTATTTSSSAAATTTNSTSIVSTSSSADSVQSVIEVGGIVESPSEDEVGRSGVTTDASEEGK